MKTFFIILSPGLIYALLFASFYFGEINFLLRLMGSLAFLYLSITIAISPLSVISRKSYIVKYRKYFGITMFYFVVFHAVKYSLDALEFGHFWSLEQFRDQDVLSGMIAFFLVFPLYLTSNSFSLHFFGKHWKTIQSLIYPLYLVGAIHIAFSGSMNIFYASSIGTVVGLRLLGYFLGQKNTLPQGEKVKRYLCIPCGFIYDSRVGDPDGGIAPGTEFEDIPDDWRCPVCGVGKSDFIEILVDSGEEKILTESKVITCKFLTDDVIELRVEVLDTNIGKNYIPGQFMIFVFADRDGNFDRRYSIVSKEENIYTFLIHPSPDGRSKKILAHTQAGDILRVESIAGNFAMQPTKNTKIAIATGTGIAPIIAMFQSCDPSIEKKIYFGLRKKEDIFYEALLRSIPNTKVIIFLSQESEISGYSSGRIKIHKHDLKADNEFYICGNPQMVQSTQLSLREVKCENIYFESFI